MVRRSTDQQIWFPMWPTLPLSLFLYSRLFPTCGSVCSHLLMLVTRSRIFLPWWWRRYVPPKRRVTQDLHSATSQKMIFFYIYHVFAHPSPTRTRALSYHKFWILRGTPQNVAVEWLFRRSWVQLSACIPAILNEDFVDFLRTSRQTPG
jgi:hypothetical protein